MAMSRAVEYWPGSVRPCGILEIRVPHAERGAFAVHHGGEGFLIAADVAGQGAADVVGAFDHQHLEQFAAGVNFTGFEAELGRFAGTVAGARWSTGLSMFPASSTHRAVTIFWVLATARGISAFFA